MKILIVAPYPPPLTGNSLPIKLIHEELSKKYIVDKINLSKKNHQSGIDSISRIFNILFILLIFPFKAINKNLIYLSISESKSGNIRDIFFYFLSMYRLNKIYIHMLGGAGMNKLISKNNLRFKINKFFVSRIAGVIVEGNAQMDTFSKLINPNKIKVIPNFAQDFLFVETVDIKRNFENSSEIRILFLSNMLPGKGHKELLNAYLALDSELKIKIRIDFAGKIIEKKWEKTFLDAIADEPNLYYHGSVNGEEKRELFKKSHVFCLPTYYKYEGQPFTIIEAYASGNAVITTSHSGINHIFSNNNGFLVTKESTNHLREILISLPDKKQELEKFALHNLELAKHTHTQKIFLKEVINFIESNN
ncbi:MAG: glycosyltransferase [Sediminibacterium sp.]|uniref:glycosyltransferase family 4 protein n=1 Tax=Sediminibacterium sp. TaxID=1917865 RepID=UPI002718A06A|nr:glycosyltransferase [Sediminibacterium sp.]MDO8997139.1 glycosyltransferase [Sediminibacterium sp.]